MFPYDILLPSRIHVGRLTVSAQQDVSGDLLLDHHTSALRGCLDGDPLQLYFYLHHAREETEVVDKIGSLIRVDPHQSDRFGGKYAGLCLYLGKGKTLGELRDAAVRHELVPLLNSLTQGQILRKSRLELELCLRD